MNIFLLWIQIDSYIHVWVYRFFRVGVLRNAIFPPIIKSILSDASATAQTNFGKVTASVKQGDNNQVFTKTDLEIGRLIVNRIGLEYKSYSIIDEEAGVIDNNSNFTWVIDPIDGTSNFAMGVPTYGIMIGLLESGMPIAGDIALTYFGDIYWTEKGYGAYKNKTKIHVTTEEKLSQTLVSYGIDAYPEHPDLTKKNAMF